MDCFSFSNEKYLDVVEGSVVVEVVDEVVVGSEVVVEEDDEDGMGSVVVVVDDDDDATEYLLQYFIVFNKGFFLGKIDLDWYGQDDFDVVDGANVVFKEEGVVEGLL